MTEILIATHNVNKRKEIKALLKGFKDIRVMNLDDLKVAPPIIVEDGKTFRQNAIKKAVTVSKFFEGLVLADDSGLEVASLDGKPGVRSARFARTNATDGENNKKLLKLLSDSPKKGRRARFVCNISLAKNGHLLENYEGEVNGEIIASARGRNGFGYDPLFLPKGYKKTFAEMTRGYKNRVSHRANALKKLKRSIRKYLKDI